MNNRENVRALNKKLTDGTISSEENWLWTGESVFCKCTHHLTQHCTHCYTSSKIFHCHSCSECEGFEAYKVRPGTRLETEPLELAEARR